MSIKKELLDELTEKHDFVIILFPKHYLSYLLKIGWFDKINQNISIIIVSSTEFNSSFSLYSNILLLPRKGVARLGEENRKKILETINSQSNSDFKSNEVKI